MENKRNPWSWKEHILQQSYEGGPILSEVHGRLSRVRNRSVTRRKIISIMFLSFSLIKVLGITTSIIVKWALLSIPHAPIFIEPTYQGFPFWPYHKCWPFPYLTPPFRPPLHLLPRRQRGSVVVSEAADVEATTSLGEHNVLHVVVIVSYHVRR